jgi:IS30 family transposase
MELNSDQLTQIEEYASLFCSIDEIALLIDVNEAELRREIRKKTSEAAKYYYRGKLATQVKLRRQTKLFAEKGSPQAEQTMKQLYEKQCNNE